MSVCVCVSVWGGGVGRIETEPVSGRKKERQLTDSTRWLTIERKSPVFLSVL